MANITPRRFIHRKRIPMRRPITPRSTLIPGSPAHTLLRRVLKIRSSAPAIEQITLFHEAGRRVTLRDTGPHGTRNENTVNDTAIQLLWARDDASPYLMINDQKTSITPGDTIVLPVGTSWCGSSSLILCEISGDKARKTHIEGPTHGTGLFHGYNRETIYPAPSGLAISRWKITKPLTMPPTGHDRLVIDLATPVTMLWPGGIDIVGHGECRLIPSGSGPVTLFPDGLGYVLLLRTQ